jgi:hypothetical protein
MCAAVNQYLPGVALTILGVRSRWPSGKDRGKMPSGLSRR